MRGAGARRGPRARLGAARARELAAAGVRRGAAGLVLLALAALASCSSPRGRAAGPPIVPASAGDIVALAQKPGARATLVNVWATWCVPCREEFPELLRLERDQRARGLRVALVSADLDSSEVRAFLVRQGVDFPVYFKVGDDMQFINTLSPRWTGALPATFVYDAAGRLSGFWEGKADYTRLEQAVRKAMMQGANEEGTP